MPRVTRKLQSTEFPPDGALEARDLSGSDALLDAIRVSRQSNIFLVDIAEDGRFTYALLDTSGRSRWGTPGGDASGLSPEDVLDREGAAAANARYRDCAASGKPLSYEEEVRTPEGTRWWQTCLTPVRDRNGRIARILGVAVDITERKRIEQRLSETERQFAVIADNLPGIVYRRVLHPDGRITYPFVSEGARRLLGYAPEELMRDPHLMLQTISEKDKAAFAAAITRSAKEMSSFELELRSVTRTGKEIWVRSIAHPSRSGDGGIAWDGLILDISRRKEVESQLAEREARLKDFAEAAADWQWETDEDHRFTRVSERIVETYGVPAEMFIGRTRQEVIDPSLEPEKWAAHFRILDEHKPFRDFVYRQHFGGRLRYVRLSGRPVFDDQGAFRGYRGTGSDLTPQHLAEERAAAASSRLLGSIEALSEGVAIFDAEDRLVLSNARYRQIQRVPDHALAPGITFEDVLRVAIRRGRLPGAVGREEAWIAERMARHRDPQGSFEQHTPEGRWLQVLEQKTPDGGTIILATDITEVKRREEALSFLGEARHGEGEFFRAVARSLAAGLGCRWAGIARLIDGGNRAELMAWVDGEAFQPCFVYDLAGTPSRVVIDGGAFWGVGEDVSAYYPGDAWLAAIGAQSYVGDVIVDRGGRVIGHVFGVGETPDTRWHQKREITSMIAARAGFELQRLEAERQLTSAKEAAELASRAKSEFLANMSHELRTPLNAIIGFSQMIAEEILGPVGRPEYAGYGRDIHASSSHLLQIINDILDVSKIEAGMLTPTLAELDFAAVAESCCRLVRAKAAAAEISLSTELGPAFPPILADERMLKQIILNLLSNALKFTPPGGRVVLEAEAGPDGGIAFTVRDTGIGIDEADFTKVMRPFGQVDSSMTRRYQGTGLGLPLTKGLAELHGGTLSIESRLGAGTAVTVKLPRRTG